MPRKSTPKRYHVVKSIQGWKVELENSAWSEFRSPIKKDVIQKAIQLAQKEKEGYVIIHKPDGTVDEERVFSRDTRKNEEPKTKE